MKNLTNGLVKKLERQVKELAMDVKAITDEHDSYMISQDWLERLPIQSLKESLNKDYSLPREYVSLKDVEHKIKLRKLYEETMIKFEQAQSELRIARIDFLLSKIDKV